MRAARTAPSHLAAERISEQSAVHRHFGRLSFRGSRLLAEREATSQCVLRLLHILTIVAGIRNSFRERLEGFPSSGRLAARNQAVSMWPEQAAAHSPYHASFIFGLQNGSRVEKQTYFGGSRQLCGHSRDSRDGGVSHATPPPSRHALWQTT